MDISSSKFWEIVEDREAWYAAVLGLKSVGYARVTEQQQTKRKFHLVQRLFTLQYS